MKSSLRWMKEYVDVDTTKDPQIFADIMTVAGVPVEQVECWGTDIKNIYTGRILKIIKHPDADHLVICQMDMGDKELTIVTGAPNVREGQVVPVAIHGAILPGGVKIKKSKLRGQVSEGMLCSAHELGFDDSLLLPEERNGIWILPDNTPVGVDAVDFLGLKDTVYEYELTPNRADCFSMVGLSREFAVLGNTTAKYPSIEVDECEQSISGNVIVTNEAPELCNRFASRLLLNVKIGKSPLWMQQRLRKSGVRPINNVVDATNYVMLELGIPMHAYDYDKVSGHHLIPRRARNGEVLKTLDGVERILTSEMLVIADPDKACGVAGVMGGFETEVTGKTTAVILEAASFKGSTIRKTGRALGLRSEASARFERGIDAEGCIASLDRCAQLLQKMGACDVARGIIDIYPEPQPVTRISFTVQQINAYLGTDIPGDQMVSILKTLEFGIEQGDNDSITAIVPSWRGDCTEMADISEEVARIYGYENIQSTRPWSNISEGEEGYHHEVTEKVSEILSACGLNETVTFSFMNHESLKKLLFPAEDPLYTAVPILNPITEEFPLMRTTLLPSLMDMLVRNQAVKNNAVAAYEIASVYIPKQLPITELPYEKKQVAGVLYGLRDTGIWPGKIAKYDFYDVKGIVETVLEELGISADLESTEFAPFHPGKAAKFVKDGKILAQFGELHPAVIDNYDIAGPVYAFEMYLDVMIPYIDFIGNYKKVAKFPAISRDLAFLAPVGTANSDIQEILIKDGGEYLESVHLFDMYQGKQVPKNYKSMAYSLTFRSAETTLTDENIQMYIDSMLEDLKNNLDCTLR
ncbi:MAG: phenylalanine--tRNA ligase subunit beta [Megasphaera sp.]|jgi:phenylalanyl-tRNA synthetase beta chain|uniref:phenylalanine--tRNA ligase subunit beta n=1 Tax=Megasphaera sueciensis TaxID=349094 RepID=UPI003D02567F|nr:phenylalanine--tRNA ligase subunit beta [Megasphaera sp.]